MDRFGYYIDKEKETCAPLTTNSNKDVTYEEIRAEDEDSKNGIELQYELEDS